MVSRLMSSASLILSRPTSLLPWAALALLRLGRHVVERAHLPQRAQILLDLVHVEGLPLEDRPHPAALGGLKRPLHRRGFDLALAAKANVLDGLAEQSLGIVGIHRDRPRHEQRENRQQPALHFTPLQAFR
jgi:hypothetical protein